MEVSPGSITRGHEIRPGITRWTIHVTPTYEFDLPERYTPINFVNRGACGVVISAKDNSHVRGKEVAIKKISLNTSNEIHWKRTLREIKLMRYLEHPDILSLKDMFVHSKEDMEDVYIVMKLMDTDLHRLIYDPEQELSPDHHKYFLYQILRGLLYVHSANILHRDMKPSNLFVNKDAKVRIADFGLARMANSHDGFHTEYVATRYYRAPEVILSWKEYTKAIDVWSVGCIFMEMLLKKPLFRGKDYVNQVAEICKLLGSPSEDDLKAIRSEGARNYLLGLGYIPKTDFSSLLPGYNPLALDLVEKMLAFNPQKRISVEDALKHPYLSFFHDEDDEPKCESYFDFTFESWQLNKDMYKELIWQEMVLFHPEVESITTSEKDPKEKERTQLSHMLLMKQMNGGPSEHEVDVAPYTFDMSEADLLSLAYTGDAGFGEEIITVDEEDNFKEYEMME